MLRQEDHIAATIITTKALTLTAKGMTQNETRRIQGCQILPFN